MTTPDVASEGNFIKMKFQFYCFAQSHHLSNNKDGAEYIYNMTNTEKFKINMVMTAVVLLTLSIWCGLC